MKETILSRIAITNLLIQQLKDLKETTNISHKEINLGISDLKSSKESLFKELHQLKLMEQFKDFPWVIKVINKNPTYFQVVRIVSTNIYVSGSNKFVTVSRKGNEITMPYSHFIEKYREATEEEVIQHINYLTKNNIEFLFKPISVDLSEIPNIILEPKPITLPKKSKDADFYMVTLKQGFGSKVYHESYEIAEKEAIRLSKQHGKKAYVLGVVGEIEAIQTTTYETKVKKY